MGLFDGQVAVVTGAARGLGEAYARALHAEGAAVVLSDILPGVETVAAELGGIGLVADMTVRTDVERMVAAALDTHGKIDILVSNAATAAASHYGDSLADAEKVFDEVMAANTKSVWLTGRAVIPHMIEAGSGHIVNISTDHVHDPPHKPKKVATGMDVYDASKWALEGFTWLWSNNLAEHGIRVNTLSMGETDTPMLTNWIESKTGQPTPQEIRDQWMRPEQVAGVLVELLAEGPDGRTGANIGLFHDAPVQLPAP